MQMTVNGFQWDDGNWPKCGKHGVSREDIETIFTSAEFAVHPAPGTTEEERLLGIGKSRQSRWVFVVFTLRKASGATFVRPISARYMHRKEVEHYEQQKGT